MQRRYHWEGRDEPFPTLRAAREGIRNNVAELLNQGNMLSVYRDGDGASWAVNITVTLTPLEA